MSILIILPTYNERSNLEALIDAIDKEVDADILIVDDNSPDGTGALAEGLARRHRHIHVHHRPRKLGLGTAYLYGFRYALDRDYELIFEMDADFSHDPAHIPRFIEAADRADVVLGSRYIPGGRTENWRLWRRALSRAGGLYAHHLLDVPYHDLTGGFKCFHRRVLQALPLSEIRSEGYSFQVEVTWRAHHMGFRIEEIPIVFRERREGQSKISRHIVFEAAWLVLKLRLSRLRGPKPPSPFTKNTVHDDPDQR